MPSSALTVAPLIASGISHVFYDIPNGGLVAWYDASRIAGISSGASLSAWTDLSGNGNHASQSLATMQPTYQTNVLNGLPAVKWSGVTQSLIASALTLPQVFTMAIVYSGRTGVNGCLYSGAVNGNEPIQRQTTIFSDTGGNALPINDLNTANLFLNLFDYSNDTWTVRIGSTSTTSTSAITLSTVSLMLGMRGNSTEFLNGNIEEVLTYNRIINTAEVTLLEKYLKNKYAV